MLIIKKKITMHMLNDCIDLQTECRLGYPKYGWIVPTRGIIEKYPLRRRSQCETRCCMVVNRIGDRYRSVRSERIVICSVAVTPYARRIIREEILGLSWQKRSRSVSDSLVLTCGDSHKGIESPHIIGALCRKGLSKCRRPSLRLALWSVG